jgi:hypothetical protein
LVVLPIHVEYEFRHLHDVVGHGDVSQKFSVERAGLRERLVLGRSRRKGWKRWRWWRRGRRALRRYTMERHRSTGPDERDLYDRNARRKGQRWRPRRE